MTIELSTDLVVLGNIYSDDSTARPLAIEPTDFS